MSAGLRLERLRIARGGEGLVALDLHVPPGEVVTIMGPSGSGKSTLLAAVVGDLAPAFRQEGRVWLDGRDITALPVRARRVGILLQDDILFPHLSVGGNLAFALPRGVPDRAGRIAAALEDAGLPGMAARDPATLSGGQRARVALMRMLLASPRALLLDEAFSRLDAELRAQVRSLVLARAKARGLPVVMVTHDPGDAEAAGGPVHLIGAGGTLP